MDLLSINVNDHTERKGNHTYLSWAWAWAEVLKADPDASWGLVEYPDAHGLAQPCLYLPDGTALVKVAVTIGGKTRTSVLPVMDQRNQAITGPNAFQINTAVMRCLTKAIAMFGLGLYIYAGEDLPEGATEIDVKKAQGRWFAQVKGTALDSDAARAAFLVRFTEGRTSSLTEYLATASEAEVESLLAAARRESAFPQDRPAPGPVEVKGEAVISDPLDRRWKGWQILVERVRGDASCSDVVVPELSLPVRVDDLADQFEALRAAAKAAQAVRG